MQIKEIKNIRVNFKFYITLLYTNGKKYTLNIKKCTCNLKNINKMSENYFINLENISSIVACFKFSV